MKRGTQFLPPRQAVVYQYTERMIRETGTNRRTFAMEVADRYLQLVAEDDRDVPFRITRGGGAEADKKHNGQILGRYLDGTVKKLPADLEDAWVLSLPQPYRADCERELARRRGLLAVALPQDDGLQIASMAGLLSEYGKHLEALAPALADGKFCPNDRPSAQKVYDTGDAVIAAIIAVRRELTRGIKAGGGE